MSTKKKYGLILPDASKPKPAFQASRNVFGNDSDSEEDSRKKPVLLRPSDNIKRRSKIAQEKAILEDPTVYQYDEIYDSMVIQKESKIIKSKEEKKPKYIENLLKTANKRKIENERRIERQIQKEREKEGEEFADKEVFVTSAYKNKLEELRLEEEKEKREEYLEKIGDVTRQQDLGGFYRHLYEQKLGSDKTDKEHVEVPVEKDKANDFKSTKSKHENSDNSSNKRNYRKRKLSHDLKSDGEIEDSDDEVNRTCVVKKKTKETDENIDADSDFSIDESSDEEQKTSTKSPKLEDSEGIFKKPETKGKNLNNKEESLTETKVENQDKEVKLKIDIWKKRTVGEVFDQALQRYYQRKAARGS